MSTHDTPSDDLEQLLLRRSVGALEADRPRCADCGRTPLTGEELHLLAGARPFRRKRLVCELCRLGHRRRPLASEVVRGAEHGQTVRLTARAA